MNRLRLFKIRYMLLVLVLAVALSLFNLVKREEVAPERWIVSPWPNGHNFAFTIIHDADDAYSGRLKPLFEVFDELGFKITVTVFVLQGDIDFEEENLKSGNALEVEKGEFFRYRNISLSDDVEREFYLRLVDRGHEIGMHTPSATSDKREKVIEGFEKFREYFNFYPRVYVEHASNFNKETQVNEGADPDSLYYCTDLLNYYGSWIWVDGHGALAGGIEFYDVLGGGRSPINDFATRQYGVLRAFIRSGKWKDSDGNGFLEWYSEENVANLERNRGAALVYTHLDRKWIDPDTRAMREDIRRTLKIISSKDVWLAPAGTILDRLQSIEKVKISCDGKWVKLINGNDFLVDGVTVVGPAGYVLSRNNEKIRGTKYNEYSLGTVAPFETLAFRVFKEEEAASQ